MKQSYIHNVVLLNPEDQPAKNSENSSCARGAIWLKNGKIMAFGDNIVKPEGDNVEVIDGKGHYLIPGIVDMRVQLCSPGTEYKATIATGIKAAIRGGVTSMVVWPSMDSMIDNVAGIEFLTRRGRETQGTKLYCYAALTRGLQGEELTEFGLLQEAGAVGFTDGEFALENSLAMYRALTYGAGLNALIIQHPEVAVLTQAGQMNQGAMATLLGLKGMPSVAEVMMVERDLRLLEQTGGRYHVAHISTKDTVDVIRRAKAQGLQISCDTAPQYFLLNELAVHDYRTFAKVNPPLRTEEDRLAIIAGLKDGTIDAIASDHLPQDQDSKRQPFEWASFGMVGLESLLALSLKLVHGGELPLVSLLQKLTCNPANLLKIDAGKLAVGMAADLTLLDLHSSWIIREDQLSSKSKNTSFDKMPVEGKVLQCWVDGRACG